MTALLEPLRLARPTAQRARDLHAAHDWLLIVVLVAAYAVLQSAFVRQPALSDQLHYFLDASTLPHISEPPHQALRIGLTIPVWLMIRFFGYSEAAYYAVPYLSAVGLIISTYWLGRLLDSRTTGAIAALLVVANPFVLDDGSNLLPDMPAAALLTGGIALLLWQWQRADDRQPLDRSGRWVLLGAGLLLGWSYLVREFIVFWFPVALLVAYVLRLPRRWWRLVAAGAAGMFAFELLWGLIFLGNPLARIVAALNQPASEPWRVAQRDQLIAQGEIPDTLGEILTAMPRGLVATSAGWTIIAFVVLLIATTFLLRTPHLRLLAAWVVVPVVLLTAVIAITWGMDSQILRPEKMRYWLPMLPPLFVGGVAALRALGNRLFAHGGQLVGALIAMMLLLTSVVLTGAHLDEKVDFTRTGQAGFLKFREWAATSGQTCQVIWADDDHWRAATRWVPMYLNSFWGRPIWDGELRSLNTDNEFVKLSDLGTGALVRDRTSLERRNMEKQQLPAYLKEPPRSWRVLLQTERDRVRVLAVGESTCAAP